MTAFTESIVEQAALAWLERAGWQVRNGAEIAPDRPAAERDDYDQVVLPQQRRVELVRLNSALHRLLLDAAPVKCRGKYVSISRTQAKSPGIAATEASGDSAP